MWSQEKQDRLDALRHCQAEGSLSESQSSELDALFAELDQEEADALAPAIERMQQRQEAMEAEEALLEAEAEQLRRLKGEHTQMVCDARRYLARLRTKRAALIAEYRRITGRELALPH